MTDNKKLWTAPDGSKWEEDDYSGIPSVDFPTYNFIKMPLKRVIEEPELDFSEVNNIIATESAFSLYQRAALQALSRAIVKLARGK